jgi:hypothetical protein
LPLIRIRNATEKFENHLSGPTNKICPCFQELASTPIHHFEPMCEIGGRLPDFSLSIPITLTDFEVV